MKALFLLLLASFAVSACDPRDDEVAGKDRDEPVSLPQLY